MNIKTVVFRTNAGKAIGMGHLNRCLSLYKAMKKTLNKKLKAVFIINSEAFNLLKDLELTSFKLIINENFDLDNEIINKINPDYIIIDTYNGNSDYLCKLKSLSNKIILIDDNNDVYSEFCGDLIINGNIHAKELNYNSKNTKLLLGEEYLIMRQEYWELGNLEKNQEGILITTGGSDAKGVMKRLVLASKKLNYKKYLVVGPGYEENQIKEIEEMIDSKYEIIYKPKSLKKYIDKVEFVITATGTTVYEVLASGKKLIPYFMVDNQKNIYEYLEKRGVLGLGNIEECDIEEKLKYILNQKNYFSEIKIDGKGVFRIVEEIMKL